jgi:hypothetical protein
MRSSRYSLGLGWKWASEGADRRISGGVLQLYSTDELALRRMPLARGPSAFPTWIALPLAAVKVSPSSVGGAEPVFLEQNLC